MGEWHHTLFAGLSLQMELGLFTTKEKGNQIQLKRDVNVT